MENTTNLDLPYIMPSQAQKHVTHNEALELLDALVQCAVAGRTLASAPPEPQEGARWIVPPGADGEWAERDGAIAVWRDGGWRFLVPKEGWIAWVLDEHALVSWTGAAWQKVTAELPPLQNLALLGVGTEADAANPFSARLNKALWTARPAGDGGNGDLRYTMNKEGAANVLSLLMQSNWSGRAEIGLVGGDDLTIKVSTDGSAWKEALRIDRQSGRVTLPYTNTLRDAVFNLLPDSGRFAGNSSKDLAIGAFSFPSYLTISNGTTAADGGKFIHNNTDYGGTAGALPAVVKDLVDTIRNSGRRRYGPEFYVAQMTMGSGTTTASTPIDGNIYYISTYFGQKPRLPSQTFHMYVRALDAPVAWIREGAGQTFVRNGSRSQAHQVIAPEDGWVSMTLQDEELPYSSYGYIPRPLMLYARAAGHRYLLACPALIPGITEVDDNVGIVVGINSWLP